MNKLTIIFSALLISISAFSQTPWVLSGNAGTNPPTDFLGTTDNAPVVFVDETLIDTKKMILTQN
jgi:hypothetical protein